ncbi:hypothetical protein Tco_0934383 [Tanacetum coccineum]
MVNLGDTVGKESEGLTSLTGIASSPSVSFETLVKEDRLSDIATKLSYPLLLDSYTAAICTDYGVEKVMIEPWLSFELMLNVLQNLKKDTQAIRGIPVKPKSNFIYRPVQTTKTKDKAPAKPKVTKATNYTTSTLDSFDALNTLVDEDNYGGMNPFSTQEPKQAEGHGKKDINTKRINKLKKQILDGKIMLVDDDGKPLNKADSDLVDSDSESDVEVAYDDTAQFMASGGANDASLYEDEDYDIYDTYEL